MGNNKIVKICIIIVIIFIIATILEISLKAISNKVIEFSEDKKEEEKQEEIYNSDEEKTKRQIAEFAEIICDAVNDGDYNYLWKTMDSTYKSYKFGDDLEKFKNYLANFGDFGDSYEITGVNKSGLVYQVMVGITRGSNYETNYLTINAEDINLLKFMFDEFISLEEMDGFAKYKDLKYDVNYYYKSAGFIAYVLNVENISEQELNIDFINTELIFFDGEGITGTKPAELFLKPGESKNIEIYFSNVNYSTNILKFEINKNGENDINEIIFSDKFD